MQVLVMLGILQFESNVALLIVYPTSFLFKLEYEWQRIATIIRP